MPGRLFIRILFPLLLLILAGCGKSPLEPLSANGVIVAFGDSLTYGVGARSHQSYPSVLSALTGHTVINAGISGETTSGGAERLGDVLDSHRPELLILLQGGNDILRGHDPAVTKANLSKMIQQARNRNVQVVLIGVPRKQLFSDSAPFYRELAEEFQLVFEEELIADLMRTKRYKSDPIHFNAEGYRVMAEEIRNLLEENGAL